MLEIAVPHVEDDASLARALREEWPSFFGYSLSFVTIGIMWINHHTLFKDIERADHSLLVLNLLLLMSISFVPFTTAVLAEYLEDADRRVVATLVYGSTFVVTAIFFNALWLYASRDRRLIDHNISEARIRTRTTRFLLGPLVYGAALALVLITPWLTLGVHVVLAALYLLPLEE